MLNNIKIKKLIAAVLCGGILVSGNVAYGINSKAYDISEPTEEATGTDADYIIGDIDEEDISKSAESDEWLLLSPENFPDDTFRWFIMLEHDSDGNGLINPDEVESVSCYCGLEGASKVYSIEGIEYFKNLKMLDLNNCEISDVDLSQNTQLTSLTIDLSNLDSIDLSNNKMLNEVRLVGNNLDNIDLSQNPELTYLNVGGNELKDIDLSHNSKLRDLHISENQIETIDLSNNPDIADGTITVDRNQKVILPEGGVKSLWINTNQSESIIDLNNIVNYDTAFLQGIDEVKGAEILNYNQDTNRLYYSVLNGDPGIAEHNNRTVWRFLWGHYLTIAYEEGDNEKYLYISVSFSDYMDLMDDNNFEYDKAYEVMYDKPYAEYNGFKFYKEVDFDVDNSHGYPEFSEKAKKITCVDENGNLVKNSFVFDGVNTYYFQEDGTAMQDRLTYHPDGEHIIYFNEGGHEVFSNFAHVKHSIEGNEVDDYCFFDVYGHMYVDVLTYDKTGTVLYYANPYGVMEMGKWFQFSNSVKWADGTEAVGIAGGYGYANSDGTLLTNTQTTDWEGRSCYLQGNGVAAY